MAAPGPHGTWQVGTIWPMDLIFMSTFDDQSMNIGYVGKFRHLSGPLRHCFLNTVQIGISNLVLETLLLQNASFLSCSELRRGSAEYILSMPLLSLYTLKINCLESDTQGLQPISIQLNSGPMVLHKCLALATCIRSKSN